MGIIITGTFTLLGIIVGTVFTYLITRLQLKTQRKNEISNWRRDKVIDIVTEALLHLSKLEISLFKNKSMDDWLKNFHKNLNPLITIFLGYQKWSYIHDELVKLTKAYSHYLQGELIVKELQIELLKSGLSDKFIENLKPEDQIDYSRFMNIIHVNIKTALTDHLKDSFEEFTDLDYRKNP